MKNKKIVLGLGIFIALIAIMVGVWMGTRPKQEKEGEKTPVAVEMEVKIEVVNSQKESKVYELKTDAKYLQEVMDEAKEKGLTYELENGMVLKVNDERADYQTDGAYWAIYVNGEYGSYGIAEQPVKDQDVFKLEYTKAQ